MWKVPVSVPGFGNVNYSNICPLSPKRGHAFCDVHCEKAKSMGYGTELKKLYESCGVAGVDIGEALDEMSTQPLTLLSDSSLEVIQNRVEEFAESTHSRNIPNASTYQGTANFLQKNPTFMEDSVVEMNIKCNKDTGGMKALHFWSRGMFFIVSAGGHIEYWQPLYKSESPTQAFLITVLWLYRKFKALEDLGHGQESIINEMTSTVLAYDNMCHMDNFNDKSFTIPLPI